MAAKNLLSRKDLADRWSISLRTLDRLRQDGRIPWLDVAGGQGARPIVRFRLADVQTYEDQMTTDPSN